MKFWSYKHHSPKSSESRLEWKSRQNSITESAYGSKLGSEVLKLSFSYSHQCMAINGAFVVPILGEGNGTPLQYSCLENPMDGRAWKAAVHGVTEGQTWLTSLSRTGERNGNPLQCSCLENPRDRRAWWATVYGVAQSRTRLKRLSSSSILCRLCKFI